MTPRSAYNSPAAYDEGDNIMPKDLKAAIVLGAPRADVGFLARHACCFEDRVEGLGSKRYQNNPAAAEIVTKAVAVAAGQSRDFVRENKCRR